MTERTQALLETNRFTRLGLGLRLRHIDVRVRVRFAFRSLDFTFTQYIHAASEGQG